MNPKRSSTLYKEVSEEINVSETLVSDIIEFYYKDLRSQLSGLKYPRINVEGLGQFVIKQKLAEVYITKLTKILPTHDVSTFRAYHNKKTMEEKLELLNIVTIKIEQERKRKEEFIKNKNNESSIESNMGEQGTDS
jgi:nucleoid DNA-binding protein